MVSYGPQQGNWFIRLRYAYNLTGLNRKYDGFNGNMHYLTIGVGGFGRRMKRDLWKLLRYKFQILKTGRTVE